MKLSDAEYEMEYEHVKKGFRVLIARPAWWDIIGKQWKQEPVLIFKLEYPQRKWCLEVSSFKKLYRVVR